MTKRLLALPLAVAVLVGGPAIAEDTINDKEERLEAIWAQQRAESQISSKPKYEPEKKGLRGGKLFGVPLSPINPGLVEKGSRGRLFTATDR